MFYIINMVFKERRSIDRLNGMSNNCLRIINDRFFVVFSVFFCLFLSLSLIIDDANRRKLIQFYLSSFFFRSYSHVWHILTIEVRFWSPLDWNSFISCNGNLECMVYKLQFCIQLYSHLSRYIHHISMQKKNEFHLLLFLYFHF